MPPLYEFECPKCGTRTSNFQDWTSLREGVALPWCEECGEEMGKVMSVPAKPVVRW